MQRPSGKLCAVLILCTLASCANPVDEGAEELEQALQQQLPEGETATIDPDTQSIRVEGDDGTFATGPDLDTPAWVDPAIPLPDDLAIETVLTTGDIESLRGTTAVAAAAYLEEAERSLLDAGWTIDASTVVDGGISVLQVTDRDGLPVDLEIGDGELAIVRGRVRATP